MSRTHAELLKGMLKVSFTLEPLDPAFSKWHGEVKWDKVLMVANNPQELELELIQSLVEMEGEFSLWL